MSRRRSASRLDRRQLEAVVGLLGDDAVTAGGDGERPVARPGSAGEVAALLRLAATERFTITPGRRASEAGPGLGLSLARLDRLSAVDEGSMLITAGAGVPGERVESAVTATGYRPLRDLPADRLVGAYLAGAPVPTSAASDGVAELCVGLQAVLADGTRVDTRVTPRSATGPDLKHLLLGTRGALGVIVGATLRLEPLGLSRAELAWSFERRADAEVAARQLHADGCIWPGSARLLADGNATLLAVALTGHAEEVEAAVAACRNRLEDRPARELASRRTREALAEAAARERDARLGPPPAALAEVLARVKRSVDPAGVLTPGGG